MPNQQIKLPVSLTAAEKRLASIDSLVTSRGWERAAIVAAFVRSGGQGSYQQEQEQKLEKQLLTPSEFAAKGIQGLRHRNTVAAYRDLWLATGRPAVPGKLVDLDGLGEEAEAAATPSELDPMSALRAMWEIDAFLGESAAADLQRFGVGWNVAARQGEANQARHLATRLESQAVRLSRAMTTETDPMRAAMMEMRARLSEAEAANQETFSRAVR